MRGAGKEQLLLSLPSPGSISDQNVFVDEVRAVSFRSIPEDSDGAAHVIADSLSSTGATLYLSDIDGNRTHAQINPQKIPVTAEREIRVAFANLVLNEIGNQGLSPDFLGIPKHPVVRPSEAGALEGLFDL